MKAQLPEGFAADCGGALLTAIPQAVLAVLTGLGISPQTVRMRPWSWRSSVLVDKSQAFTTFQGNAVVGYKQSANNSTIFPTSDISRSQNRVRTNMDTPGEIPEAEAFIAIGHVFVPASVVNGQAVAAIGTSSMMSDQLYLLDQMSGRLRINDGENIPFDGRLRTCAIFESGIRAATTTNNATDFLSPYAVLDATGERFFPFPNGVVLLTPRRKWAFEFYNDAARTWIETSGSWDWEHRLVGYRISNWTDLSADVQVGYEGCVAA